MSSHYQTITIIPQLKDKNAGLILNLSPDSDDTAYVDFSNSNFPLPSNIQTDNVKTLSDLINYVGRSYVSTKYYVGFKGTLNPSMCASGCRAYVNVASFANSKDCGDNTKCTVQVLSAYSVVYSSANMITENDPVYSVLPTDDNPTVLLGLWQKTTFSDDSKCFTCDNSTLYTNASLWMKIEVTVNMYDWCTIMGKDNISNKFCYNFIGDYCTASPNGCDNNISTYLRDYCTRRYPYPDYKLDIFNSPADLGRDYNICACNMDPQNYTEYGTSLQNQFDPPAILSAPAPCVFPACKLSNFLPDSLQGCPGPTCVNAIILSGNTIEGDPKFEQENEDCYQYVSEGNSPSTSNGPPSGSSDNKTTSQPFWKQWWFALIIIILIALIVIAVIGGVGYTMSQKKSLPDV